MRYGRRSSTRAARVRCWRGPPGSAGTGAVGVARADPTVTAALSTVDNVRPALGQISTVLALREQVDGARPLRHGPAPRPPIGRRPVARTRRGHAAVRRRAVLP